MSTNCEEEELIEAALGGNLARVKRLVIDCGVDPNVQDDDGDTPLHLAAWNGYLTIVKFLLEHGADPNIQDDDGDTPLDYGSNCEEIIEEFMRGGGETTVYE